jgi:hypothetical protein
VVAESLTQSGFYVLRSFDLHSILSAECHFAVLLIYGESGAPLVMTSTCQSNQTRFQIVRDATTIPDPQLVAQVMSILENKLKDS